MKVGSTRYGRLHPASWPIALKMALAFAAAALVPMLIASYYNLQVGLRGLAANEAQKLEQLASSTGSRIDQLVKDIRHTIAYFGWSEEVIHLTSKPTAQLRAEALDKMFRLIAANQEIELLMVLDGEGKVLAATKPQYLGRKLDFRDYFKEAIRGRDYISDIEVGTASYNAGMYFSSPVRNQEGRIAGVVVLKLREQAVTEIIEAARNRDPSLIAFLIDGDGIIIYHPDRNNALYHSMGTLQDSLQKKFIDEKRFGLHVTSIPSLQLQTLADAMLKTRQPSHIRYVSPISKLPEIAGFAPLSEKDWRIVVTEPETTFSAPLDRLFNSALKSVVLVGGICVLVALVVARGFTRRINKLTRSAAAIERGDFDNAKVPVSGQDELGRFAATFNDMIDAIKQRQRERDIFGRLVSPEVREKLLAGELKLGGENLRVSVLFSDIREFSSMAEKMSPQDVVAFLNEYLTEMSEAVRPWGGYINNFIGDAIVVIFGAPNARAECEWSAICAARAMRSRIHALNQRRKELGDPPIVAGIGISTGKVVAGQIGSLERFMYTVIGDAVNVAARLESLTKEFVDNPILINAATYENCKHHADEVQLIDKGLQHVKGRKEPVHVYAVGE